MRTPLKFIQQIWYYRRSLLIIEACIHLTTDHASTLNHTLTYSVNRFFSFSSAQNALYKPSSQQHPHTDKHIHSDDTSHLLTAIESTNPPVYNPEPNNIWERGGLTRDNRESARIIHAPFDCVEVESNRFESASANARKKERNIYIYIYIYIYIVLPHSVNFCLLLFCILYHFVILFYFL